MSPAIAFDGTNALVAWSGNGGVRYARITESNALLDPTPVNTSPAGYVPRVAWNGSEYLIVWTTGSNHWQFSTPGLREVRGARVAPSGVLLDPTPIDIAIGADDQFALGVASTGGDFVVLYLDQAPNVGQISPVHAEVKRVMGNGLLRDVPKDRNGITVASPVITAAIAARDGVYVAAYVALTDDFDSSIHVESFDPASSTTSDDAVVGMSEGRAEVALGGGSVLLYTRFAMEMQYAGAWRLFLRSLVATGRLRTAR